MVLEKPISITVDMACRASGLTRNQIYDAIRRGQVKTAYVGKRRLVLWRSLEEFIEGHTAKGIDPQSSEQHKQLRAKRTAKAKEAA